MRKKYILFILPFIIFLSGCHGVAGNVVPQKGPSMEAVYDSMGAPKNPTAASSESIAENKIVETVKTAEAAETSEENLEGIRQTKAKIMNAPLASRINTSAMYPFKKLPNPELKLYVYPHFAGNDEIPIPGYYTEFTAYEKTHYALTSETICSACSEK